MHNELTFCYAAAENTIQEFLKLNYSFTAIRFKPYKPPYVYNGCPDKTSRSQSQYICETSIANSEYENDTNVVPI